ncbi:MULTISPECIES: DUF3231 family protein [Paenibacillus]|uniref:DUF3231 family protein n=1 Tax=Paenibacillus TaxID=44249 RepID=UPI0022B936F0|nr:DUF3231 family protein [Paenibacillus caseinilyticus]MCZ8518374.1 DUF3231 family protein [Paenibacillus caseinilyticus]
MGKVIGIKAATGRINLLLIEEIINKLLLKAGEELMEHNSKLTASEIAVLWNAYMQNTMSGCIVNHFQKVNEDKLMDPVLKNGLGSISFIVEGVRQIFSTDNIPIPDGFTEDDYHSDAPRIYSDLFALRYMKYMAAMGTANCAVSLELSARADTRQFFTKALELLVTLFNQASELLLQKGAYIRSPIIPIPEKTEYVKEESFLSGIWGRHRPVTSIELAHISKSLETNSMGRTFILGFAQVARSSEVKNFMARGKEIAEKHEGVFREVLLNDDIPLPSTWDSTISPSTKPPFSDKLMMFHVSVLNATSIANYGASIAGSLRRDLGVTYNRLMTEVLNYADDGAKIMIKNHWLEQPPQAPDRVALRS